MTSAPRTPEDRVRGEEVVKEDREWLRECEEFERAGAALARATIIGNDERRRDYREHRVQLHLAAADRYARIAEMIDENRTLREELWLRHGCPYPALYGDDGEMSCNDCMIDFKREPVSRILERLAERAKRRVAEAGERQQRALTENAARIAELRSPAPRGARAGGEGG